MCTSKYIYTHLTTFKQGGDFKMINKQEFINKVIENTSGVEGFKTTKKDTGIILEAVLSTIMQEVANGEKVTFQGFGAFEPKEIKARDGFKPGTKEPRHYEASVGVKFGAGKNFKDLVKGK